MISDSLKTAVDTLIFNPKLSKLKPIILPEPIKFEPVTLGWYIVLGIIVFILLYLLFNIIRKYKLNAYRRFAANELLKIKSRTEKNAARAVIQQVSTILKITAINSYSREKTAKLYGKDWQEFLISRMPSGAKIQAAFALLNEQYIPDGKKHISPNELQELIDASIKWVRRHRV